MKFGIIGFRLPRRYRHCEGAERDCGNPVNFFIFIMVLVFSGLLQLKLRNDDLVAMMLSSLWYLILFPRLNQVNDFGSRDASSIEKYMSTAESRKNILYHLKMGNSIILLALRRESTRAIIFESLKQKLVKLFKLRQYIYV